MTDTKTVHVTNEAPHTVFVAGYGGLDAGESADVVVGVEVEELLANDVLSSGKRKRSGQSAGDITTQPDPADGKE